MSPINYSPHISSSDIVSQSGCRPSRGGKEKGAPLLSYAATATSAKKCDEEEKAIYIKLRGANGGGPSHEAISLSFPLMASWAVAQEMRKKKLFSPNQKKGAV